MSETPEGRAPMLVRAGMYSCALSAGVVLVLSGKATPYEATAYVSPFLVFLPKGDMTPSIGKGRTASASRKAARE
ncbi:hypothetical protein GCM10010328_61990 [Streptomyces rubiginosohelvolus]|uniref:Integral membrane protein n=1 Tax=Streptomyces rubiginosohelvolus TaxID=67362 RepID=A0ABQ3C9Z6_9ACTN|nr:hypothetical protein GCM10010328_61990 [Streptomyces pluricolorescens]